MDAFEPNASCADTEIPAAGKDIRPKESGPADESCAHCLHFVETGRHPEMGLPDKLYGECRCQCPAATSSPRPKWPTVNGLTDFCIGDFEELD